MNSVLRYKGYSARPEFSVDDKVFYGKILGIDDLVDFYTADAGKLEEEFHAAVDDYLEFCEEVGKAPQKEYNGSFSIRVAPELHRKAATKALEEGTTLNRVVEKALEEYFAPAWQKKYAVALAPEIVKTYTSIGQTVDTASDDVTPYYAGNRQFKVIDGRREERKRC